MGRMPANSGWAMLNWGSIPPASTILRLLVLLTSYGWQAIKFFMNLLLLERTSEGGLAVMNSDWSVGRESLDTRARSSFN
jgi:hypothetical protein